MDQSALVAELKASLQDAATMFTADADADFVRHLQRAADDMHRVMPNKKILTLTLTPDHGNYAAPTDLVDVRYTTWGDKLRRHPEPWRITQAYQHWAPPQMEVQTNDGVDEIALTPAPSSRDITMLGAVMAIHYTARWQLANLPERAKPLLMLRAQAEAMLELSHRGIAKPVQLRDGQTQGPANGSPASMYESMMRRWLEQAA